jgi:hypothetical protein
MRTSPGKGQPREGQGKPTGEPAVKPMGMRAVKDGGDTRSAVPLFYRSALKTVSTFSSAPKVAQGTVHTGAFLSFQNLPRL